MNVDGSNLIKIVIPDTTLNKSKPSLSFDNKNIVYSSKNGIYQINVNGENYKKLNDNPNKTSYTQPNFASGDNSIIFAEYNDSTVNWVALHLFNLVTLQDTIFYKFSNSSGNYNELSSPKLSPDGAKVIFEGAIHNF
jgi:hypothetical protein